MSKSADAAGDTDAPSPSPSLSSSSSQAKMIPLESNKPSSSSSSSSSAGWLPTELWLRIAFLGTAFVFLINAIYVYGPRFPRLIHSDAAVTALLGAKMLAARGLPVVSDFYYANGDVWMFGPHWLAVIPIAILGLSVDSLRVALILGLAAELAALYWAYRELSKRRWLSLFAGFVTLMAWALPHLLFVYIELSYGWVAAVDLVWFTMLGSIVVRNENANEKDRALIPRRLRLRAIGATSLLVIVAVQNPTRFFVLGLAPFLAACLWPWRGLVLRRRLLLGGLAIVGWGLAFLIYRLVFVRVLTFSPHPGHTHFEVRDFAGILENIKMLGRGLYGLGGVPALLVIGGALVLLVREIFASRELTLLRLVCVVIGAQLGIVLTPLLIGNLMLNPLSARYLMPALLPMAGLATILGVRALSVPRGRLATIAWLAIIPVAALISFARNVGREVEASNGYWANRPTHADLAEQLSERHLTHGFATYWNAALVTLLSKGATKTCAVYFDPNRGLLPQKWVNETSCFDAAALPERFYVVADPTEGEMASRAEQRTFFEPIDRFSVSGFHVSVFQRTNTRLVWLNLPIPEGDLIRFPLRVEALSPQIGRAHVDEDLANGRLVATGEEGTVVYGPYVRVPKGHYVMHWQGRGVEGSSSGSLTFDIVAVGQKEPMAKVDVPASSIDATKSGRLVEIGFSVEPRNTDQPLEFRVWSLGGAKVMLEELVISRR